MAVLLPEPESPVTTTRRRPSVMLIWGPVQCSGAARPARFRCPQTPSASSSALALGLLSFLWLACSRAARAADRHPRGFRRTPQTNARAAPAARCSSALALGFHLRWWFSSLRRRSRSLGLSGAPALAAGDLGVDALGEVERAVPAARAEEVVAGRGLDQHRHAAAWPDGDAHQGQLHLEQRIAPRAQAEAIGAARPLDQLDHQVDLALVERRERAEECLDVDHSEAADLHVVPEETRGAPAHARGRGAAHLYHVVGDQAVPARHQVERRLALADPALAEDEDAEAVHLHQVAVEIRLRRHAVLEPGGL